MLQLRGLRHAERFVNEQQQAGADCWWDGWDICFFRPAPEARTRRQGAFRNGAWGYENRSVVNSAGIWEVDYRNVERKARRIPTPRR